ANLGNDISDFDLVSIHQANKMIIDNVAKRIKAPQEKVINSIERFGNTRGASTAVNICDYAENNNIYEGDKKILALAFGIGLNVTVASFTIDMSVCLPIIKTSEVYDDGIDSETYFK
ncbi:3-oxoacyl-[acyl-carrier-protein] synthase III C-terminal domain-containing protein, partial [Phascolarctobacterium faecium]